MAGVSSWHLPIIASSTFSGYLPSNETYFQASSYWVAETAAQVSILAAAQINGIPAKVSVELEAGARACDLVRIVVKSRADR